MTFRSTKKQAKEVYLYEPINNDDGESNSISLLDLLETTDEDVAERLETEEPQNRSSHEKTEITQREIAKKYGISRSYVSRIEKKALEKLRRAYEENVQ